ncbi:2-amino-5-chloromuconate deaminase CnbZ [Candidatus Poriferisodalis sp.]|uniref:2-amino-5-chloromuconate deaminase CnbZ n=1 Tax=Candidatus Poriferisodalis sp. TaxID=3101277 RepID=UPI003C6EDF14
MLIANPRGGYRFLTGISPFSSGVVAEGDHEIVHATLGTQLPWRKGFELIDAHLSEVGRERQALCAIELRCPVPYSMPGFMEFNAGYVELVRSWDLYVDDHNPVARTNVAPAHNPPTEPVLHAFSYTAESDGAAPATFVVSGAGEIPEATLDDNAIIRKGETGSEAMREKAGHVVATMGSRLGAMGASWDLVTTADVYTVFMHEGLLEDAVIPALGPATRHGLRWYRSRPPVHDLDFEMDVRGIRHEITI